MTANKYKVLLTAFGYTTEFNKDSLGEAHMNWHSLNNSKGKTVQECGGLKADLAIAWDIWFHREFSDKNGYRALTSKFNETTGKYVYACLGPDGWCVVIGEQSSNCAVDMTKCVPTFDFNSMVEDVIFEYFKANSTKK